MSRAILVTAMALSIAACTAADETPSDTLAADTASQPAPMATPSAGGEPTSSGPAGTTAPAPGAPTTGARRTIHVVLDEWTVSPSENPVSAGPVTFHVMNQGDNHHALEVERGGQEWATSHMAAGGTATINVDLTPGTYTLYCPINDSHGNHRQRGMRATLTVR